MHAYASNTTLFYLSNFGMLHERETQPIVSENQKPNMSDNTMRVPQGLTLIATKREMRELRENPSIVHYVLICKGEISLTNTFTNVPPPLMSLLQEFQDVFSQEVPPGLPPLCGIEHRIDLILGAPLPNRPPTTPTPKRPKRLSSTYKSCYPRGTFMKA